MDAEQVIELARAAYRDADQWWQRELVASESADLLREYAVELWKLTNDRFSALTRKPYRYGDPRMVALVREMRRREAERLEQDWKMAMMGKNWRATRAARDPDVAVERSLRRLRQRGIYTGPKEST